MDKELKAKWVEALRSGEYEQADGVLKCDTGYCCLGVLREVAGPDSMREDDHELLLHREDADRIGIDYAMQKRLSHMNDGWQKGEIRKHSFAEIADYIEANL